MDALYCMYFFFSLKLSQSMLEDNSLTNPVPKKKKGTRKLNFIYVFVFVVIVVHVFLVFS